ncbi:NlpC/P60 family protein, partial [Xenorhabdus hominickii]
ANEPNHAGVYIGDGLMLHHLYGQLSNQVPYDGYWQDRTIVALRYTNPPAPAGFLLE